MQYTIAAADSRYKLQDKVTKLLNAGWQLQGGVYFCKSSAFTETWTQALYKDQ